MKKSKLWIKVDKMLWEDWDPIAVNDYGESGDEWRDEYSGYVPSIVKLLLVDADVSKITKLLYEHANVNMGLSTHLTDHSEIAEKLKSLTA